MNDTSISVLGLELPKLRVENEFQKFAATIAQSEQQDFFDPRNRKTWMREFGFYLQLKSEGSGQ